MTPLCKIKPNCFPPGQFWLKLGPFALPLPYARPCGGCIWIPSLSGKGVPRWGVDRIGAYAIRIRPSRGAALAWIFHLGGSASECPGSVGSGPGLPSRVSPTCRHGLGSRPSRPPRCTGRRCIFGLPRPSGSGLGSWPRVGRPARFPHGARPGVLRRESTAMPPKENEGGWVGL